MLWKILVLTLVVSPICTGLSFDLKPIEAGFQQLSQHRTQCAYLAIHDLVDLCRNNGAENIDGDLRLRLAVDLSICEFLEANISYPEECRELEASSGKESYLACVSLLRSIEQFWTTYSGNYRKLRLLCYEELAPFLKDSILNLYLNITKLYANFFESADVSARMMNTVQDESLGDLRCLRDLVSEIFREMNEFEANLKKQHSSSLQDNASAYEASIVHLNSFNSLMSNSFQEIIDETEGVRNAIVNSASDFEIYRKSLESENQKALDFLHTLVQVHNDLFQSASCVSKALDGALGSAQISESKLETIGFEAEKIGERLEGLMNLFTTHFHESLHQSQALIQHLGNEVLKQTDEFNQAFFAAAFPYISRLSSIGTDLELKLKNASVTAADLAEGLNQLELKVSAFLKVLFEGFWACIASFFNLSRQLLLVLPGYFGLFVLWKLWSPSIKGQKQIQGPIFKFLKSIVLGILTAFIARSFFFS